jgi:hypothetical protein
MILLPSLGAASECPSIDDLKSGVRIELSTGAYSIHTLDDNGIVVVEEYDVSGRHYRTRHFLDHVLEAKTVEYDEIDQSISYEFDFSYEFRKPLRLEVGSVARGTQFEKSSFGKEYQTEYTISILSEDQIAIGGCTYTFLTVKKQYVWSDDEDEEVVMYLRELGLLVETDPIPYNLGLLANGKLLRLSSP